MRHARLTFGSRSLAALAVLAISTQAFHPRILTAAAHGLTAAWMVALSGAAATALLVWPAAAYLRGTPGGTFVDLARDAVGRGWAAVIAIIWAGSIVFGGTLILRQTSEMAISAAFPHTPETLATVALLVSATYVALGEGSAVVRIGTALLPFLMLAIAVVVAGSAPWGEYRYLLPFWGPGPAALLLSAPAATGLFVPGVVVLAAASGVDNRSRLPRWALAAFLIGGLVIAVVKVVLGMVFPYPIALRIPYPLHEAARLVLATPLFERLEGIWMFNWVACSIVVLGAFLFSAAVLFTRAFAIARHQVAVPALATLMLTVAFFAPDQATTVIWQESAFAVQAVIWLVLPALLAAIAALRMRARQRGRQQARQQGRQQGRQR